MLGMDRSSISRVKVILLSNRLHTNGFVFWEEHKQLISRVVLLLNQKGELISAGTRENVGLQKVIHGDKSR